MQRENKRRERDFGQSKRSEPRDEFEQDRPFSSGPREMHKATCSECGSECEVPFKPTEGKPVYCRECFAKRRPRRF